MLTKQGKVLQAKAIAGSTLTITKMKLGSGIIPDGVSPEDLTDLIQPKQALGLTAISVNGGLLMLNFQKGTIFVNVVYLQMILMLGK